MDQWIRDDVLTGRAGVNGLRTLLYGRTHRAELHRAFDDMLMPGASVTRCELERAKFKPDRKLIGYFHVHLRGPTGAQTRAAEVTWSKESGPDRDDAAESAMQHEARECGVATPLLSMRNGTASGADVRVAPLDAAYPQLVRLSRPDHVRDLLHEVAGRDAPGHADGYTVATLRYRPRQRHVLRFDLQGVPGAGSVFAKLYRNHAAAGAFEVAAFIADRLDATPAPVSAVRPLGVSVADDVVLYPLVAGVPVSRLLPGPDVRWHRHVVQAGTLLRALHDTPPDSVPSVLPEHDLDSEIRSVVRASEHLTALVPATAARVAQLLETARTTASAPPEPPGLAHGDFKADHVWADGDHLTLLDFDTCCRAEPALDVGKFLADVSWWYAQEGDRARQAQELFLQGYGDISAERLSRARVYEAVVLTKLTIRRLRRFEPDWARRSAELVEAAARRLEPVLPTHT